MGGKSGLEDCACVEGKELEIIGGIDYVNEELRVGEDETTV